MEAQVSVKEQSDGIYTQDIGLLGHHILSDEPLDFGSANLGFTPLEMLAGALGSCTTIILRMHVGINKWPVTHIACDVNFTEKGVDGTPPQSLNAKSP